MQSVTTQAIFEGITTQFQQDNCQEDIHLKVEAPFSGAICAATFKPVVIIQVQALGY